MSHQSFKNHMLVALPALQGGIFERSLVYVCEHNSNGAMGIIVNKTLDMKMGDVFDHLDLEPESTLHNQPVHAGGPVGTERGFVLHPRQEKNWDSSLHVSSDISLTTSMDVLRSIADRGYPSSFIVALGYAGWGEGQLESELSHNSWLTIEADQSLLFDTPWNERLDATLAKLGISYDQLTTDFGTA